MSERKTLWPYFTFYGGKWRIAKRYPKPIFDTVIEPFAGSAGYSVRYYNRKVILIEKDPIIASVWKYLINVSPEEILSLPDIRDDQTIDDLFGLTQEQRWLIGFWLNKGTVRPCKKPSAWMKGRLRPNQFWGPSIRNRIASMVDYTDHWRIIEGDYTLSPNIEATWFVDPPYQFMGKHYKYSSNLIDYGSLAEWCKNRIGQVIVCEAFGADWLNFEPFHIAKANPSKYGGKKSFEVIWTNENDRKNF